ncbi:MAG TPA: hypothetical protein VJ124_23560 [Pyrinomonadaceae bacterium]|nr:hypothetical protein [Pyrinomonadaceae bacterium]
MSNKTINDGGQAFPAQAVFSPECGTMPGWLGLSVRQWYAGEALKGILSSVPAGIRYGDIPGTDYAAWAACAHRAADAMIAHECIEAARGLDAAGGK